MEISDLSRSLKKLIICIAIPLAVGTLSGFLTRNSREIFENLNKPPLSPPGWLFPVVWTILFTFMGIASYLVLTSRAPAEDIASALKVYVVQLAFNFLWSILFFGLSLYLPAFFWLVLLELLILAATILFFRISHPAGILMLPYLLWVAFAGYLNLAIILLNS